MTQEEIEELESQRDACQNRIYGYKQAIKAGVNPEILAIYEGRLLMAEARLSQIKDKLAANK